MAASTSDKLTATFNSANPNVARVTSTRTAGNTTLACDNLAGWPTVTKVHFATYRIDANNAVVAGTQIDWYGIVSGNNITNLTRLAGATDAGSAIGDVVEAMPTGSWAQGIYDWGTQFADTQGNLVASAVRTALGISSNPTSDWALLNAGTGPNTVTDNGNGSYDMVFNSVDLTGTLSPGMRTRTTRTVAAPTQCTSLNGTTQYYSKTSPAGMTQTDSITESAWIKPTAYQTSGIISRNNGTTDGWKFYLNSSGQIVLAGARAADDLVTSYQSVPLNKWTHVSASINTTTTTGVITVNGISVPVSYTNNANTGFAAPTAAYLVGATNGTSPTDFFAGKIAQAASYSAVISVANILTRRNQTLAGTETSLISAYSFNNSVNDLNTTNANNLTPNGSAVATNTDSPFGVQASGNPSSSLDYQIVHKATFSTNTTVTVQVPEGCTIPTSGGVSSVNYASVGAPYGFPRDSGKWMIEVISNAGYNFGATSSGVQNLKYAIAIPTGKWITGYNFLGLLTLSGSGVINARFSLETSTSTLSRTSPFCTTATAVNLTEYYPTLAKEYPLEATSQTTYTMNVQSVGSSFTGLGIFNDASGIIYAKNAYL